MKKTKSGMKQIDFKIPESYLESLDELVDKGFYANRAEAMRTAIMDLLKKHGEFRIEYEQG